MTLRLIAISGSLKGTTFTLAADEISIGRDLSNNVSLDDPSVSRRHCLINKNGTNNDFHVVGLESYNGTFVNGVPVAEQSLTHGDQLALGDIRFIFLTHEDAVTTAIRLQDDDLVSRSTIRLEREQAFYLRPEGALPSRLAGKAPGRSRRKVSSRFLPMSRALSHCTRSCVSPSPASLAAR